MEQAISSREPYMERAEIRLFATCSVTGKNKMKPDPERWNSNLTSTCHILYHENLTSLDYYTEHLLIPFQSLLYLFFFLFCLFLLCSVSHPHRSSASGHQSENHVSTFEDRCLLIIFVQPQNIQTHTVQRPVALLINH